MAPKTSCGVLSTENVVVKLGFFMACCPFCRYLHENCRGHEDFSGHKTCVLTLERLGYASAPALRDGLRRWIREDVLFTILQPIEDAHCDGFRRGLRYLEASGHVGVNRAKKDAVDRHALARQQRSH